MKRIGFLTFGQLSSPVPLLAAVAARTSSIEIGTAVIDMRYESPLYMAEEAAATDAAVQAADTLLLTVPNQLGVDYNAALLDTIARHIAPAVGWSASALS